MSNNTQDIEKIIEKASKEDDPLRAMQFTQAALNAANAVRVLADMPDKK